jgi:hypothetical protein
MYLECVYVFMHRCKYKIYVDVSLYIYIYRYMFLHVIDDMYFIAVLYALKHICIYIYIGMFNLLIYNTLCTKYFIFLANHSICQ